MIPREFWIAPRLYSPADPVEAEFYIAYDQAGDPSRLEIHTIEFSAYLELKNKIENLESTIMATMNERDGARKALEDRDEMHSQQIKEIKAVMFRQEAEIKMLKEKLNEK